MYAYTYSQEERRDPCRDHVVSCSCGVGAVPMIDEGGFVDLSAFRFLDRRLLEKNWKRQDNPQAFKRARDAISMQKCYAASIQW